MDIREFNPWTVIALCVVLGLLIKGLLLVALAIMLVLLVMEQV